MIPFVNRHPSMYLIPWSWSHKSRILGSLQLYYYYWESTVYPTYIGWVCSRLSDDFDFPIYPWVLWMSDNRESTVHIIKPKGNTQILIFLHIRLLCNPKCDFFGPNNREAIFFFLYIQVSDALILIPNNLQFF